MSAFDAASFFDATIETPTERRELLPVGDYRAVIGEVNPQSGEKDGKPWVRLEVPLIVDVPPAIQQEKGLPPTLTFRDSIFLDVLESGAIDNSKGKNSGVRRYREALDMNKPGDAWSPRKMQGRVLTVKIKHGVWNNDAREEIAGVAKAS